MQLATHVTLWCSVAGVTVLGAVGLVSRAAPVDPVGSAPVLALDDLIEPSLPVAYRASDDPTPPQLLRYAFVIDEPDATYVKLVDAVDGVKHGKPRLLHRDYEWAAIAEVANADLPDDVPRLAGRTLIVDGSCTATITGFAILARLTGSPAYAGLHDDDWTARTVFDKGQPQLVARLSGCAGKPDQRDRWARDAALPAAIVGTETKLDHATSIAVEADLFRSDLAKAADASWDDPSWGEPEPGEKPWRATVEVTQKAYTHATTGERWIVIRAFYGGVCGMKTVDIAAIYRERTPGKRVRVWSGEAEDVAKLVDLDGDGAFELLVHAGFGDETDTIQTLTDGAVDSIALPYFGCPC